MSNLSDESCCPAFGPPADLVLLVDHQPQGGIDLPVDAHREDHDHDE
ncbi:MAG: hypothetical protein AAGI48_09290 [Verrucomicrobiota bacterium]